MDEERKRKLLELVGDDFKASQLVEEIIFLEERMNELKKLPFIAVHPSNSAIQKATPASRQYKEFLQQYNNCLRLLFRLSGDLGADQNEEESPLRKWVKDFEARKNKND